MSIRTSKPYLTRESVVSDINPQCFSRGKSIGDHWDQTTLTTWGTESEQK